MTESPKKKRMGRPPGRAYGRVLNVRISTRLLKEIEAWRKRQADAPSQGESVRRLIESALRAARDA
jgi:hypothetical protein